MENQRNENSENISVKNKKQLWLSIVALLLEILPFMLLMLVGGNGFTLLFLLIAPIAGLILGVDLLRKGKKNIGIFAMTGAIIAIALPSLLIGCIIVFFIGITTGLIPLM